MSTKVGFNPTQEELEEQIRQLPMIKPEKAVVLEYEDVAPRWTKCIVAVHTLINELAKRGLSHLNWNAQTTIQKYYKLSITEHKHCLVGEAHGFDDSYNYPASTSSNAERRCDRCHEFSHSPSIGAFHDATGREFEKFKTDFMQHYNEVHL